MFDSYARRQSEGISSLEGSSSGSMHRLPTTFASIQPASFSLAARPIDDLQVLSAARLSYFRNVATAAGAGPAVIPLSWEAMAVPVTGIPHRAEMEAAFGEDFSSVRAYPGQRALLGPLGARGATVGDEVAFDSVIPQAEVVAHELAHVVQHRRLGTGAVSGVNSPADPAEREAQAAARAAVAGGTIEVGEAPTAVVGLDRPGASPPLGSMPASAVFDDPKAWSSAGAVAALDAYRKLSERDRRAAVEAAHGSGSLAKVLKALPAAAAAGLYREPLIEILRWVEELVTRKAAGKTDEQIAEAQAKFMRARAEAEAKAAAKAKGVAAPTAAEVEKARVKQVEATSITPATSSWGKLSPAEQAKWTSEGKAAVAKLVAYAKATHPELGLTDARLRVDFEAVDERGVGVIAFGEPDGKGGTRAVVGFHFVEVAKVDPAYVLNDVVHEIMGHPEYGEYGTEYHLKLYDVAASKLPGYVRPTGAAREAEIDAFAYQETEIYSLLRELPYFKPVFPADAKKGIRTSDPKDLVADRIALVKRQWEPGLAVALLRGLYARLRVDPRITPTALAAFEAGVKKHLPAAQAATILK
jgi:hypothetical protein